MERVLRFNAEHDFLTKLPNRSSFFQQANVLLDHVQHHPAEGRPAAWPLIDIDFGKSMMYMDTLPEMPCWRRWRGS